MRSLALLLLRLYQRSGLHKLVRGARLLKRPQRGQQSWIGRLGGGIHLEHADERGLQGPDQMGHGSRIVSYREAEESFGPRLVVGVLGPGQERGPDIRAVDVGERAQPERGPVADLGVGVSREADERGSRLRA